MNTFCYRVTKFLALAGLLIVVINFVFSGLQHTNLLSKLKYESLTNHYQQYDEQCLRQCQKGNNYNNKNNNDNNNDIHNHSEDRDTHNHNDKNIKNNNKNNKPKHIHETYTTENIHLVSKADPVTMARLEVKIIPAPKAKTSRKPEPFLNKNRREVSFDELKEHNFVKYVEINDDIALTDLSFFNFDHKKKLNKPITPKVISKTPLQICKDGKDPYLIILVCSGPADRVGRMAIRNTWGKATSAIWPHTVINAMVKVVFVIGVDRQFNLDLHGFVDNELKDYNDILYLNITEGYYELTLKMLTALTWVHENCQNVQFLLKSDVDTFINVPILVNFLLLHEKSLNTSMMATFYNWPGTRRGGKWGVSEEDYPLPNYPSHASGTAYLISTDSLGPLLNASLYYTRIHIEDAFITGILAKAAKVRRLQTGYMSSYGDYVYGEIPKMCTFLRERISFSDCTPQILDRIWLALEIQFCKHANATGLEYVAEKGHFKPVSFW